MTKEEILRIKKHIEIHARQERGAVIITRILRKAVDELEHIADLEKENAELKEKYVKNTCNCDICDTYCNSQLIKAKEIIRELLGSCFGYNSKTVNYEVKAKAEQFLKETENAVTR